MTTAKYIGNPAFRVHTQTGTMLGATTGRMTSTSPPTYRVNVDTGRAPHAAYVIQGTRVMLPRDVVWSTLSARETRKAMMVQSIKLLGKALRTQPTVRFSEDASGMTRLTILNMNQTKIRMHDASVLAMGVMGAQGLALVKHNMSLTDHTQADLRRLDHPYARRHGSIRIHG